MLDACIIVFYHTMQEITKEISEIQPMWNEHISVDTFQAKRYHITVTIWSHFDKFYKMKDAKMFARLTSIS